MQPSKLVSILDHIPEEHNAIATDFVRLALRNGWTDAIQDCYGMLHAHLATGNGKDIIYARINELIQHPPRSHDPERILTQDDLDSIEQGSKEHEAGKTTRIA
jgi:hypothetical protein